STSSNQAYALEVIESSQERTVIRFNLSGFHADPLLIEGRDYLQIKVPGLQSFDQKGLPELPRINRNIVIPQGAQVSVKVISLKDRHFDIGEVNPSKGPIERS